MPESTINAVMRMRRGFENDLDISKLQVGEWALSVDSRYVRICYSPGRVIQIATQETMDATMAEIEAILDIIQQAAADVASDKEDVAVYKNAAAQSASQSGGYMEESEAWARGTRNGTPVPATDPAYHNNSKYYAEHPTSPSLGDITDVDLDSPENGQTLVYNSTSGQWENGSAGGGGSSTHEYSTTEHVVGTWIDGKPVYEKTVNFGNLPTAAGTTQRADHNIANLKEVIAVDAVAIDPTTPTFMPLTYAYALMIGTSTTSSAVGLMINSTQISIASTVAYTAYTKCYVTLRYTKTTD